MEYTKGEWKVYESPFAPAVIIKGKPNRPNRIIAICRLERGSEGMAEATANAHLIAAAPNCYEELREADRVICELCKRLNPQHATADYGKGCEWCQDKDSRLKALAKAEGK